MTAAKPPAVDDLDAAYAEIRKEPYTFTWAGHEWSLPHFADLDYRTLMRIESHEHLGADELMSLFGELFSADQRDAWANAAVPLPVLFMLFDRWTKHSGGLPGEDSASSGSSGSTGTSSRRTSGTTTTGSASRSRSTAKRAPRKAASPPANSST